MHVIDKRLNQYIYGRRSYAEQFRVKGLAQDPRSSSLVFLGFEPTTFRSLDQRPHY